MEVQAAPLGGVVLLAGAEALAVRGVGAVDALAKPLRTLPANALAVEKREPSGQGEEPSAKVGKQ